MVDLPQVPRRLALTQTPRSRVTGADIARPGMVAGEALESLGAGVMELERAVRNRELTGISLEIEDKLQQMRQEYAGNPEGFKAEAVNYSRELQNKQRNPVMRRQIAEMVAIKGSEGQPVLGTAASRHYDALSNQLHAVTFDNAKKSMVARIDQIDEQMAALAHEGIGDAEFKLLNAEKEEIYDELARQPLYGVPPEIVDQLRSRSEGRLTAEAIVGAGTRHSRATAPQPGSVVDRIIGAESSGDPTAQATGSTATGLGQFTEGTWLEVIQRNRPDLAGLSREEKLALRTDPALSREMTEAYADQNGRILATAGHPATARNIYLAHFLGPAGALGVLNSAPSTGVREALIAGGVSEARADEMIAKNASVLSGKTVSDVASWAAGKMGDSNDIATMLETALWDPSLDLSPEDRRRFIGYGIAEANRLDSERTRISGEASEAWERQIIDGAAELSPLPPRSQIEDDPNLTETARNPLLKQYDAAAEDVNVSAGAYQRFTQGGPFNAFDSDDKKAVDKIWKKLGGDGVALKTVVDQTGIVPSTVVTGMRGDLVSPDPERLGASLQLAANLIAANPNAFAGHDGASDIEKSAFSFRHYIDDLGYTAEQATAKIAQMNTPEFKSETAKIKDQDIAKIARDELSVSDLRSAFDAPGVAGWLPGRPTVGFTNETRQDMFNHYAELFRDRYAENNGDVAEAKANAIAQLKQVWAVTRVNGSDVVVPYAPERVPGMERLEDASELIAMDAIESIKAEMGADVKREDLIFRSIPGKTATDFKSGRPVPYLVAWRDDNEILHWLPDGRAFAVDPSSLSARQTKLREQAFRDAKDPSKRGFVGRLLNPPLPWESARPQPTEGQ
jgi:hypothetical protein